MSTHIITAARVLTGCGATHAPGAVVVDESKIAWVGPGSDLPGDWQGAGVEQIDLPEASVLPGLIDAHVHLAVGGAPHPPHGDPGDHTPRRRRHHPRRAGRTPRRRRHDGARPRRTPLHRHRHPHSPPRPAAGPDCHHPAHHRGRALRRPRRRRRHPHRYPGPGVRQRRSWCGLDQDYGQRWVHHGWRQLAVRAAVHRRPSPRGRRCRPRPRPPGRRPRTRHRRDPASRRRRSRLDRALHLDDHRRIRARPRGSTRDRSPRNSRVPHHQPPCPISGWAAAVAGSPRPPAGHARRRCPADPRQRRRRSRTPRRVATRTHYRSTSTSACPRPRSSTWPPAMPPRHSGSGISPVRSPPGSAPT